jgi:acyl carrier protein
MDLMTIVAAMEATLSDILRRPVTGLTTDTRLAEDLHLDSTTSLELLMGVEDRIGISVDPEQLDMADFKTVGTFAAMAQRYLLAEQR